MNRLVLMVAVALTGACASIAPPTPTPVAVAMGTSLSPSTAGSPALVQAGPSTSLSGSPSAAPQAAPRPPSGEYAVTANLGDHTLWVVSIGVAGVIATVQLNSAPRVVGTVPNSDTAVVADDTPDSHVVALVSLNSRVEIARIDVGTRPDQILSPPVGHVGPVFVVSDEDNSIRSIDPMTQVVGAPLALGVGPHTIAFGGDQAGVCRQYWRRKYFDRGSECDQCGHDRAECNSRWQADRHGLGAGGSTVGGGR